WATAPLAAKAPARTSGKRFTVNRDFIDDFQFVSVFSVCCGCVALGGSIFLTAEIMIPVLIIGSRVKPYISNRNESNYYVGCEKATLWRARPPDFGASPEVGKMY